MNKYISIRDLADNELQVILHPHAIINQPISYFVKLGVSFIPGLDDLGDYDSHEFMLEYVEHNNFQDGIFNQIPFMLIHRDNYPIKNLVSVELPINFNENQVDIVLTKILAVFDLSDKDVYWKQGEYFDEKTRKVNRKRKMKL